MARLYSNENFPLPAVDELRRLGHDVLTIQETGKAGQAMSDEEVLAFANKEKRILLTRHPNVGIFACTFDPDFSVFAAQMTMQMNKTTFLKWLHNHHNK